MTREELLNQVKATVCGDREQAHSNPHITLAIARNKKEGVITIDYSVL